VNTPDDNTLIRAVEDARRILAEYATTHGDASSSIERLLVVLNREDVVHALERVKLRQTLRIVK
jgi:hypothetical protein